MSHIVLSKPEKTKEISVPRVNIVAALALLFAVVLQGQQVAGPADATDTPVRHAGFAECALFIKDRMKATTATQRGSGFIQTNLSNLTQQVALRLPPSPNFVPGGTRTDTQLDFDKMPLIDRHIYSTLQAEGVTPANRSTDAEFLRRVTLDLTGRVPEPARVTSFLNDTRTNKRELLIDELLAKPEWVDKWTMYFGDLLKNNSRNTQINRYADGVTAFYNWIRTSLQQNKPYNQMATELITATGPNSYLKGELNFLAGAYATGGPLQDVFDKQASETVRTFLGIAHIDCILCHNGRGHLDTLSLWGRSATRQQAWGLASFYSRTLATRVRFTDRAAPYYWTVEEDPRLRNDYTLNTDSGNRPARTPLSDGSRTVAPTYPFGGQKPNPNENYRVALARFLTTDPQFGRATVNFIWEQFFNRGLVTPSDAMDPARLDPDNPPPAPWALQATHPRLLNELGADFVKNNFNLKWLMKQITMSEAYQMSSRYPGEWRDSYEPLFARKLVRRLWGEEVHDAIAATSGLLPSYNLERTYEGLGTTPWAMKSPEPAANPDRNGSVTRFLDSFLRGDRDEEDRNGDGSLPQALSLMNDPFVLNRIRSTGTGANANLLLVRNRNMNDEDLVATLFLTVLSRPATEAERTAALAQLKTGNRNTAAEDLLWALYNKVDFIFNY